MGPEDMDLSSPRAFASASENRVVAPNSNGFSDENNDRFVDSGHGRCRILVIDDSAMLVAILKRQLSKLGFEV